MRLMARIPAAVVLFGSAPAVAHEWTPFVSIEDGFSAVYPGPPRVETITPTEYRMTLSGRVYSAEDAMSATPRPLSPTVTLEEYVRSADGRCWPLLYWRHRSDALKIRVKNFEQDVAVPRRTGST
jgi:hypothetical protein